MVETVFDTLNCKAALFAIDDYFVRNGVHVPVMVSGTITDASGRTLSGQTTEAFWNSISHARPFSVGLNCALGAKDLRPYIEELSKIADVHTSLHPNAGLPNAFGEYDETPEYTASFLSEFARSGFLNIAGGCCGTTPAHIRAIVEALKDVPPRKIPVIDRKLRLSGLEPLNVSDDSLFVNVGERTNVTGSKAFARLILAGNYTEALSVARSQVENGAQIIDVNMDEAMLDSKKAMVTFLNLVGSEPDISRVPVMIDSSKWDVIEAGLKCVQGKCVVNSISMKEGEAEFIRQARLVRRYGAAAIVMAFDEKGQADTLARRIEICTRAYHLLVKEVGFPVEDIIFDPNIFAVATGIEEHSNYAIDYIEATRAIRKALPHAKISGGVSNISFSFRGNDPVRAAIHTAFLFHAIKAGMTMGIVNAGQLGVYEEIPKDLLERVEDVLFNRRPDATERLVEFAESYKGEAKVSVEDLSWRKGTVGSRITHALVRGINTYIVEDTEEARQAVRISDPGDRRPADGRHERGRRPVRRRQDVPAAGGEKSARVMKEAVAHLIPYIEAEKARSGTSGQEQGQDRDRHGQGRRARHRQEHRFRRAPVQQLRRGQPRCHGAGGEDSQDRARRERRHHRALRPDHAVSGGNGARGEGNGAPGLQGAAADRWRHHFAGAHRGENRTELFRPDGMGSGRFALGRRVHEPDLRWRTGTSIVRKVKDEAEKTRTQHKGKKGQGPHYPIAEARKHGLKTDWKTYVPPVPSLRRPEGVPRLSSRGNRESDRLDAVFPDLGTGGTLSEDSAGRDRRRGGAQPVRRRAEDAGAHHLGEMARRSRGDRIVSGQPCRR